MHRVIHILINVVVGLTCFLGYQAYLHASQEVRGIVVDRSGGAPLPGASVLVNNSTPVHTDEYGKFALFIEAWPTAVTVSLDGYVPASMLLTEHPMAEIRITLGEKLYLADEVLISTLRLPQSASLSSVASTVVDGEQIRNSTSLADALLPVAGLFIKDYGGSSGLKTIAQRGLGPEHTLVLLNGMRVSNPQNNLVDLGLISPDEIERIEILHGGNSAGFGADAVAGVVNVITNRPAGADAFRASAGFGSFGFQEIQLSGATRVSGADIRVMYREEEGDEDFPFLFRNGPKVFPMVRQNADFKARLATVQSGIPLGTKTALTLFGRMFTSDRGVGGLVVGPASSSIARQADRDNLAQVRLQGGSGGTLAYRLGLQVHQNYQRYVDDAFVVGSSSLDNYYNNTEWRIEPGVDFTPVAGTRIAFGGELALTLAEGNSLAGDARRQSYGVYTSVEQQIVPENTVTSGVLLYPALRYDAFTTGGTQISSWSPQIGIVVPFREIGNVRPTLRGSVGRNFAAPTFNMLYYAGGGGIGNPFLRPERSTSADLSAGIDASFLGQQSFQAAYFDIRMSDRIVWVAAGGASVTPKNIRSVRSRGVELSYRWALPAKNLVLSASYSSFTTRKTAEDFPGDRNVNTQLIYVPGETAFLSATFTQPVGGEFLREIGGTVTAAFTGFRYTTEDNTTFLPSHTLAHVSLRTQLAVMDFLCDLRFGMNNVFDQEYQTIVAYPMPGRSFRLSLGITY